jgi:hypothetical protein
MGEQQLRGLYERIDLLRDCQYAIEAGDDLFAPRMKRLLLKAIALQRRRLTLPRKSGHSRRVDTKGECSDDSKTAKDIYSRAESGGRWHSQAIG